MGPLKSYLDACVDIWNSSMPAARIGIALLTILCAAAIIGVGYWSAQPTYMPLITNGDQAKIDQIIDALDKEGIEYELSGAGGNLKVDKRDFANASRIARGHGVASSASSGFPTGGAFGSPDERRNLARMQKQQSLAETIRNMNAVDDADVHLNIPDKGPFERKSSVPSASVMLTLAPDARLTNEQAVSIASIVAFAVEDLEPESVQITDKDGRSYSIPDEQSQHVNDQVEYTIESERKLARKAEAQLIHFLGHGNANVEVSLDYTFANGTKKVTSYDSEGKVPTEEDLNTETTTNSPVVESGAAGVDGNIQAGRRSGQKSVESKLENVKTSYLVPTTEETMTNTTPIRNLMTVSVVVNSAAAGVLDENGATIVGLQDQVQSIVENAVGFKNETDTISVVFLPFSENEFAGVPFEPPFDWTMVNEIVRNASLAVAAIVALLVGFLLLRKIKPSSSGSETVVRLDSGRAESINQLSDLVKSNPEVFTQIIKNWSEASQSNQSTDSGKREAA